MLLQDAPPDTSAYMVAGYAVFFVISAIYLASFLVRRRNLEQDFKTLESIEADANRAPVRTAATETSRGRASGSEKAAAQRKQARKKVTRRK
jgi:preprotein translocase subunit SecF